METVQLSPQMLKKRKFLIFLPIVIIPFITILFDLFKGRSDSPAADPKQTGFNLSLPNAKEDVNEPHDKLGYYALAAADSAKLKEWIKNDPGYQTQHGVSEQYGVRGLNTSLYGKSENDNSNLIYQRLNQLNRELDDAKNGTPSGTSSTRRSVGSSNADIDRLDQMMTMMGQPQEEDPEMRQLNGMLEKILDIQHPQRVQEKIRNAQDIRSGSALHVRSKGPEQLVSLLENGSSNTGTAGFFSEERPKVLQQVQNAVQAVVHENQTVTTGSTVKMRLLTEIYVDDILVPKDNFIYGVASLNGERLEIEIKTIRFNNSIYPVKLSLFDLDGLAGVRIPDAIGRSVAKESADQTMQGMSFGSLDPSWGMQAAGAGLEVAKSLVGRKMKLIKVTVKAGYKVLLRDESDK